MIVIVGKDLTGIVQDYSQQVRTAVSEHGLTSLHDLAWRQSSHYHHYDTIDFLGHQLRIGDRKNWWRVNDDEIES